MKKNVLSIMFVFGLFFCINLPSSASYVHNYYCNNSYTVCRNGDCTTYCNDNYRTNNIIYNIPRGYNISYEGPFGGISISGGYIGIGFNTVSSIHRHPHYYVKPIKHHKPAVKPVHRVPPSHGHHGSKRG